MEVKVEANTLAVAKKERIFNNQKEWLGKRGLG